MHLSLRFLIAVVFLCAAALAPARAQDVTAGFRTFLEADIWPAAKARGVPRPVFDAAFRGVSPNLKLPDLQLPGAKASVAETNFQAEFKSGAAYLSEGAVAGNARQGRALIAKYRAVLNRIEARFGVPAPIIVAIWGREFGVRGGEDSP